MKVNVLIKKDVYKATSTHVSRILSSLQNTKLRYAMEYFSRMEDFIRELYLNAVTYQNNLSGHFEGDTHHCRSM